MHHSVAVQIGHGLQNELDEISGLLLCVVRLAHDAVEQLAALHQLRHYEEVVALVKRFVQSVCVSVYECV